MKRYVTIDFLRGIAIFGVAFMHLFSDLFNQSAIFDNLDSTPLSFVVLLLLIVYLGTWGGLFVMISATGNMFSMYSNYKRGKSVKQVMKKQVVGGFLLLFFSILVEGIFQRYAFFGTLIPQWGPPDPSRIIWHSYSMTPVHCLAVCMIINGLVQGLLSRNGGYKKIKRNIFIYAILAITVVLLSQIIWDFAKNIIEGYPNAGYDSTYDLPGGYHVQMPLPGSSLWTHIWYFLLMIIAGSNTPIFPFLAVSFIGNIMGLILLKEKQNSDVCKKGIMVGFLIILSGIVVGLFAGAGFDEFLPLNNNFDDITDVSGGLNWLWFPWFCFQTGGEVIMVFLLMRLIEFRGKSEKFAKKTKFFRRFGVPAFTTYSFHRFWAIPPTLLLSWISGVPYFLEDKSLSFGFTLVNIAISILFIHMIFILWEKIGYIGSLEWAMGTIAGLMLPGMPKAKSSLSQDPKDSQKSGASQKQKSKKIPFYLLGKINVDRMFYNAEWLNKVQKEEKSTDGLKESKLSLKLSIICILASPFAFYPLIIALNSKKTENSNKYNRVAVILSIIDLWIAVGLIIGLSFLNLGIIGISF